MNIQAHDVNHAQIEHLCAGYRAGVEVSPFSAADRRLLRAAARSARYRALQHRLGAPSALLLAALLAVLGSAAAGWFDLSRSHPRSPPAAAVPLARLGPATPPVLLDTSASVRGPRAPAYRPPGARLVTTRTALQVTVQPAVSTELLASTSPEVPVPALPPPPALDLTAASAPAVSATAATAPPPAAASGSATGQVDLNAPGALASLRVSRPQDYGRIVAILAGITRHPQRDVPRWLQTAFDARNIIYQPLWLTSFPPKRRLSFSLESQSYRAVLTITGQGAHIFPADGTTVQRRACPAQQTRRCE